LIPSFHLHLSLLSDLFLRAFPPKPCTLLSFRMPCPSHLPWHDLPNDIYWWVQIMKFLTVQLPPFPRHITLLGPDILLKTLFSDTLNLCSSLSVRDQVSHPHKTSGRIMVLYILTFTFLDSRRDDKRLWTECYQAFPEFSLFMHAVVIS
jgi:hypothetical protein